MIIKCFALGSLALAMGCATVPDDAPKEFHEAQASIERMDDNDVDDYFPETTKRANERFDQALELLDDSRDENSGATKEEAISVATEAKNTADGANRLYVKVKEWDKDQTNFQDALAMLDNANAPDVAIVETTSPFAKLKGSEIISTVAFFDTDNAEKPVVNDSEVSALVSILEKDPNFQVILTGYADPRGDESYNKDLALRRAKTIASELEKRGVMGNQMIIESAGEENSVSTTDDRNLAHLQLDRKVQAKVVLR